MPPENIKNWIIENYKPAEPDMLATPLHFTANEDNSSVSLVCWNDSNSEFIDSWCEFQYSMTGKDDDWKDYPKEANSEEAKIKLNKDKTVYFRATQGDVDGNPNLNGFVKYNGNTHHKFIMEGSIKAGGNIQFLLENTGTKMEIPNFCYAYMFTGCSSLTQAPALPATTLAEYCYTYMFQNCSSLTQAPALPATTLTNGCYMFMFQNCSSLTQAPALPATT